MIAGGMDINDLDIGQQDVRVEYSFTRAQTSHDYYYPDEPPTVVIEAVMLDMGGGKEVDILPILSESVESSIIEMVVEHEALC